MKDQVLRVRLSSEQLAAIEKAAAGRHLSVSAWVRMVALQAAVCQYAPGGKHDDWYDYCSACGWYRPGSAWDPKASK